MLDISTSRKLSCCFVGVLIATTLVAQEGASSARRERGDLDAIRKVSTLIGTEVMNSSNSTTAVVRDLALNPDGAIPYAVLGYGGVAGVGESYTAVPLDALEIRHDNGKWAVNLNMSADEIKKAPVIRSENYRELTDTQWIARVDQFFLPRARPQENGQQGARAVTRERLAVQQVLLATKLRSAKLKNNQNADLGKMEDLLLDRNYRTVFAIIGHGGVLGIGEHYIPIPWSKLNFTVNRTTNAMALIIDASKDQLEKAPLVKGDNYATLLAPGFAEQVRRYFGVKQGKAATGDDGKGG